MTLQETILLGLKKAQGMPLEQAAAEVARYIEIANELSGAPTQSIPAYPNVPATSGLAITAGAFQMDSSPDRYRSQPFPEPMAREPMAAPQRIITGAKPKPVDFEYRTVEDIAEYLDKTAPATLDVMLKGAQQPVTVRRKIEPMDQFGLVKLRYGNPANDPDAPAAIFKTTDEHLGLAQKLEEIKAAVCGMFSVNERKIEPRQAPAVHFNPMTGAGGFGGGDSTETEGGMAMAAQWAANRSPEQEKFMRGQ